MTKRFIGLALAITILYAAPALAAETPPQLPTAAELALLKSQMDSTLVRVRAAQSQLDALVADYEKAGDRLTSIIGQVVQTESRETLLNTELDAAQSSINQRASSTYRQERLGLISVLLSAHSYREFTTALTLMKSVVLQDAKAIDRVAGLKQEAAKLKSELQARKQDEQRVLTDLSRRQRDIDRSLKAVGKEFEAVRTELEKRKSGFAFPVKAPYSYTDTWGAPRMEGTQYYHRHEGTDIFALGGTPVVAVVNGVIENMGTATLGGIKLWIRSPGDNWSYYYAHLSSFAAGMSNGKRVTKGEIVGYVGNTGNARGTPPHLHFETHIPSGPATNPFPILKKADPLAR
ncbi:MAG: peptidoglycan DD-metalloendopeptidase family protein [Actinomycetota bacterium]